MNGGPVDRVGADMVSECIGELLPNPIVFGFNVLRTPLAGGQSHQGRRFGTPRLGCLIGDPSKRTMARDDVFEALSETVWFFAEN